jgi:tight adherence protein B
MLIILTAIAFCIGVAIVFASYFGAMKVPGMVLQRKLDQRLQEISMPEAVAEDGGGEGILKTKQEGMLPALDRVFGGTAKGTAVGRWIDQSGMKTTLSTVLAASVGVAIAMAFLLNMLIAHPFALMLGAGLGFAMPWWYVSHKRTRRLRKFEEEFPDGLDLIARALKAGHAFATGLKMVADEMDEPVGPEFRKTFDEQNFGLPMKDALTNLTERIPSLDVRFFSTAVLIQRETGGNLAEILENLGHIVRERFKILRQVRVHTAHGRFTGWVLLALPVFLCIALSFINPEHMDLLFKEPIGRMLLLVALILQVTGYVWIRQVIKIEV